MISTLRPGRSAVSAMLTALCLLKSCSANGGGSGRETTVSAGLTRGAPKSRRSPHHLMQPKETAMPRTETLLTAFPPASLLAQPTPLERLTGCRLTWASTFGSTAMASRASRASALAATRHAGWNIASVPHEPGSLPVCASQASPRWSWQLPGPLCCVAETAAVESGGSAGRADRHPASNRPR